MGETYYVVEENVELVRRFKGDPILHPKYQCSSCGHIISPSFAQTTGQCGYCYEGKNNIGEYLEKIYPVTIYASQGAFRNHTFTNAVGEVKQGEHAEEMADILRWGIERFDQLDEADYIVPPPRGESDADINHMKGIGEILSSMVDIPVRTPLRKSEDYTSQKDIEDPEERKENLKDKITCQCEFNDGPFVVVIDDVATTGSTLKYSAKALVESGADRVLGLVLGRAEKLSRLKDAEIYTRKNKDDSS